MGQEGVPPRSENAEDSYFSSSRICEIHLIPWGQVAVCLRCLADIVRVQTIHSAYAQQVDLSLTHQICHSSRCQPVHVHLSLVQDAQLPQETLKVLWQNCISVHILIHEGIWSPRNCIAQVRDVGSKESNEGRHQIRGILAAWTEKSKTRRKAKVKHFKELFSSGPSLLGAQILFQYRGSFLSPYAQAEKATIRAQIRHSTQNRHLPGICCLEDLDEERCGC